MTPTRSLPVALMTAVGLALTVGGTAVATTAPHPVPAQAAHPAPAPAASSVPAPAATRVPAPAASRAPAPAASRVPAPAATRTPGAVATPVAGAPRHPSLTARYGKTPRSRLGMTAAQQAALLRPYDACLRDHGGEPTSFGTENSSPGMAAAVVTPAMERADRLCAPLQPKPAWEYDAANPDSGRFVQAVVVCLGEHGVTAERGATEADGTIDILLEGDAQAGLAAIPACEAAAS